MGQGAGFEAFTSGASEVMDAEPLSLSLRDNSLRQGLGVIGGIIQYLYFHSVPRVIHAADGFNEAVHHIIFIVKRKLNGDQRPRGRARGIWEGRGLFIITPIEE